MEGSHYLTHLSPRNMDVTINTATACRPLTYFFGPIFSGAGLMVILTIILTTIHVGLVRGLSIRHPLDQSMV
jgi:hypothetical protein